MSVRKSECEHSSWDCSGTSHQCNDCHWVWQVGSWYAQHEQVDDCDMCLQKEAKASEFITKDSGHRESFETGAVRDTQDGKPRYELIPPKGLKRVAELYARGAEKYDPMNWTKGMPTSRFMASMLRHAEAYRAGERDEDHIAAVIFNALAMIEFEGTEFDDLSTMWTDDDGTE